MYLTWNQFDEIEQFMSKWRWWTTWNGKAYEMRPNRLAIIIMVDVAFSTCVGVRCTLDVWIHVRRRHLWVDILEKNEILLSLLFQERERLSETETHFTQRLSEKY